MMTGQTSSAQDTLQHADMEVMKSEMANIRADVQSVSAKMDVVMSMQITLTQLQERYGAQQLALDRAFLAINDARGKADMVSSEQSRMMSFVKGGAVVGALLFAFTQWYIMGQITKLEDTARLIAQNDRRIMFIETKLWPQSVPSSAGGPNGLSQ